METLRLVSISFHNAGKIFDFDARDFELSNGMQVIVETERGRALGKVVREPRETKAADAPPKLKAVLRTAAENDLAMAEANAQREEEALKFCRQRIAQRNMEMKLVRAEYLFDGSKIVFYFTADGRVDFRELVRDLAQHFRTRIEMRQIGVRDEAKLVGGLGVCGRELCCASHLRSFAPVSVKMAKAQGLALNPNKISGQCGRLLCCLAYEYETYNEMRKNLPKCGKKVQLESGPAEVISLDVLGQKMTVCCANGERTQVHLRDLKKGLDKVASEKPQSVQNRAEESKMDAAEKKPDEARGEKSERRKRPSRSRRPKSPQQKADSSENRSAGKEKPEPAAGQKQADAQQQKPKQDQGSEQSQNRRRRNRRRPRRRPGNPQDSDNKS